MEKLHILLVCSAGMSSAMVVQALSKEAVKHGKEITCQAIGSFEVEEKLKENPYHVVFVAPQIRHRFAEIQKFCEESLIPCALIAPQAYSPLGGSLLYEQALSTIKQTEKH